LADKFSPKNSVFLRFTAVAFQMAATIGLFTWLGTYLDKRFENKTPWWTIGLAIFGVVAGLVSVIREVIKLSKDDQKID
jgi:ATP synthase protein I